MRRPVNSLAVWSAACAIAAAAPAPTAAAEDGLFGGWVPSFAVSGDALMQRRSATVQSMCARGSEGDPDNQYGLSPPCIGQRFLPVEPGTLRPLATGAQWDVAPGFGLDFQMMTPTIPRIPGRPRLFAWGELQFIYASDRNVANEGDPTGARPPENNPDPASVPTVALVGVGSRTTSKVKRHVWGAGGGIAFPFRFRGHQLWVKPGAAWTRYHLDIEGIVEAGLKNDLPAPFNGYGSELRVISLLGLTTEFYDGIGPTLEVEMDVGKFGPIGASLFLGGGAYKILGNRSANLSDVHDFPLPSGTGTSPAPSPDLPPPVTCQHYPGQCSRLRFDTYTADWTHEVDPWLYRARVGLRFSWLGN